MEANKILIADDVEVNRSILKQLFRYQYEVLEAGNGEQTVELIRSNASEINVILLDVVMPKMNGFEVLSILQQEGYLERIPVVMITGDASKEVDEKGYEYGVADIIRKPFEAHIVRRRIRNVIDLYRHQNRLRQMVEEQTAKIREQSEALRKTNGRIIETLSAVVEFRDAESSNHIHMIKKFTRVLAEYIAIHYKDYQLTEAKIDKIVEASAMHDIGKIAISDTILLKPGRLTEDEYDMMKQHTTRGCEILEHLDFIEDREFYNYCYDICMHHHEKYDGKGYPDGLKGNEISIAAQIVSLADCYDALIRERVYKKAVEPHQAAALILSGECGMYSPVLLDSFNMVKIKYEEIAMGKDEEQE